MTLQRTADNKTTRFLALCGVSSVFNDCFSSNFDSMFLLEHEKKITTKSIKKEAFGR